MTDPYPFRLFQAFGIELEYVIVDADTLDVRPVADRLLQAVAGSSVSEVECGDVAWSNELVLHVIELKTNGPAASFDGLGERFQQSVGQINHLLEPLGAKLMPTGMHPWMNPATQTRLWPHEYSSVYRAYHRIFNCHRHGWANLQAVHLNVPFAGDEEFGRLHAAIRLVLPLLPALAASTPVVDGHLSGLLDTRLDVYRTNAIRIPSLTGRVIPEPVFTRAEYERRILKRMYQDIRPYDARGTLQHEFLNSRGAIARFDRGTIEIRLLDMQECPAADVAICAVVARVLQTLTEQRHADRATQSAVATDRLVNILLATIREAERATIADAEYLDLFGFPGDRCTAGELWHHLCHEALPHGRAPDRVAEGSESIPVHRAPPWAEPVRCILRDGPLARRIVAALGGDCSPARMREVYGSLSDCLAEGRMFLSG